MCIHGRDHAFSLAVIHTHCYTRTSGPSFAFPLFVKSTLFGIGLVTVATLGLAWPDKSGRAEPIRPPSAEELRTRNDALARARVFRSEPFDPAAIDFSKDPNSGVIDPTLTTCRFKPEEITGTTPKFDCELPNGENIKVKYGWTSEIPAEIAATRLLHALGFGADRMSRVKTLRCFGCVVAPFHVRAIMQRLGVRQAFDKHLEYDHSIDFQDVAVERKLDGDAIGAGDEKGWGFYELSKIDPARGGASRAQVDALRLMAMFLSHWDNKPANQRLICVGEESDEKCAHPLAMIQDTGSDFGPSKMDLKKWSQTPLWSDAATCTLSMKSLPYEGATFKEVRISEEGRKLLSDRMTRLSKSQIETLFTAAGFEDVPQWVAAFQEKVRQLSDRPSCPSGPSTS